MTGNITLSELRGALDDALQVLRRHGPAPQSPYYLEYQNALVALDNVSMGLYVRRVAPSAVETGDPAVISGLAAPDRHRG